jgi:hypothetical protein
MGVGAVVLLARTISLTAEDPEPAAQPVQNIAVVRTWDELLRQKPIRLAAGGEVRVGISAQAAPVGAPPLVYCVTRDAMLPGEVRLEGESCEVLGPLCLMVRRTGDAVGQQLAALARQEDDFGPNWRLFALPVAMSRPGEYEAILKVIDGPQVASVKLRCKDEPYHAWMLWGQPDERQEILREKRADGYRNEGYLVSKRGPLVIPVCDGFGPLAVLKDKDGAIKADSPEVRGRPLPSLDPPADDASLTIRLTPGELWVDCPQRLTFEGAKDNLLVRWWVNEKPVSADTKPFVMQDSRLSRVEEGPLKLRFEMQFAPARIGAKSGDRVALQVLYTRCGWNPLESEALKAVVHREDPGPLTLLSNRVEWKVP